MQQTFFFFFWHLLLISLKQFLAFYVVLHYCRERAKSESIVIMIVLQLFSSNVQTQSQITIIQDLALLTLLQ